MSEIDRLKGVLESLKLREMKVRVYTNDSGTLWAEVESPDFDDMDEAQRRARR